MCCTFCIATFCLLALQAAQAVDRCTTLQMQSMLCCFAQIPSDKVPFNQAPDMKAYEITEAGKEALRSGKYKMVSAQRGSSETRSKQQGAWYRVVLGRTKAV
jgi:hypothetical protein